MRNHKLSVAIIFLLVLVLIGSGIFQTYRTIRQTTGRAVPVLWDFQIAENHWEIAVLGSRYLIRKEDLRLDKLQIQAKVLVQEFSLQSKDLWVKAKEALRTIVSRF